MKKFLLLAIMICVAVTTFAQFNKKRIMIGGAFDYKYQKIKTKSSGNTTIESTQVSNSFIPSFGFFVADNFAVGLAFNTSINSNEYTSSGSSSNSYKSKTLQIQPFAKYYLKSRIFFQGEVGIGFGTEDYSGFYNDDDENFSLFHWGLSAGYAIVLNDHIAIEPALGYTSLTSNVSNSDTKNFNNGIFMHIGIQVYLGKK